MISIYCVGYGVGPGHHVKLVTIQNLDLCTLPENGWYLASGVARGMGGGGGGGGGGQGRGGGGGGGRGARGPWPPPKLLMVNFPINLRCYVLLVCRVINVILAIHIGDSAFFDIAALVRQFGSLRHHQQTESIDRLRRYLFLKKDKSVLFF